MKSSSENSPSKVALNSPKPSPPIEETLLVGTFKHFAISQIMLILPFRTLKNKKKIRNIYFYMYIIIYFHEFKKRNFKI